jgi:polyisoprenoid-binding protein YceI
MMKFSKSFFKKVWVSLCLLLVMSPSCVFSDQNKTIYQIDQDESWIYCSVKFLVMQTIKAQFRDFSGRIEYDPTDISKSQVKMIIKTPGLNTGKPMWNRIILSPKILDASRYPEMTFDSQSIVPKGSHYEVAGLFGLHGVSHHEKLPFEIQGPFVDDKRGFFIKAKGKWVLNRKNFKVVWNMVLDHGGVVVGDSVAIDWEIKAYAVEDKKEVVQ